MSVYRDLLDEMHAHNAAIAKEEGDIVCCDCGRTLPPEWSEPYDAPYDRSQWGRTTRTVYRADGTMFLMYDKHICPACMEKRGCRVQRT